MPTKIADLKPGDTLYDVHSEQAGSTTMRREGCWRVQVKATGVDDMGPWADLSWNTNPARRTYGTTAYTRWPKEWIKSDWASERKCALCAGKESEGHKPTCNHPKAVKARAKC